MSRPYAEVIGDPIAHSKSPAIHGFWLEALGIDADYRACHVRGDELADYFERRSIDPGWRGSNVTIPHKQAAIPFLDVLETKARAVGAVNTILRDADGRLHGTNTDVDGIDEAIAPVAIAGRAVTVIGSGGAARAAFALLSGKDCGEVRIWARSTGNAAIAAKECGLEARIVPFEPGTDALSDSALVINATQLGMLGQAPMPDFVIGGLDAMAADGLVFDMVYAPLETGLLAAARARGRAVSDGLAMLVGQAATAFEYFFGSPPPRSRDAELRAMLTS